MVKEKQKKFDIPFIIRKSRKSYVIEYSCGTFLLILLLLSYLTSMNLKQEIQSFILGLGLFALASAEISRILTSYKIGHDKIEVVHGLIKQDKKNVYYHPLGFVPDINIKQGRLQRVLGYGTIYVAAGSGGNSFEIKDVDDPHKIIEVIEKQIEINKHPEGKKE
jgi:hypothetical protein